MKNLAPNITRQRLLIEGFFTIDVRRETIIEYFNNLTTSLALRMYGEPTIFSPGGEGKEENQGFDAFVPLIDSGISLYVWSNARFVSLIIYTCKSFDRIKATEITRDFFKMTELETQSF